MNPILFIKEVSLKAAVGRQTAIWAAKGFMSANLGVAVLLMGLALFLAPMGAHAAGLVEMLGRFGDAAEAIIDFVMLGALVVGVLGIAYGCKLILDKSNDRENVKNGHIVVSFVGGAFLCLLWFVVTMLAETVGGDAGQMGTR